MSVKIKQISEIEELAKTAELAEKIWHECFKGIISDAQIDYMVDKYQSFGAMTSQINSQEYRYFGVYDNVSLCGYFAVKPETDDRLFLSKLYLEKESRGRGIGRIMLERVFSEAKKLEKNKVYLTVNKHNDRAVEVYKKVGFTVIGSPVTDIGGGFVMDDYIMEYTI